MMSAENCVLILLAAGRSSRFPGMNKLEAEFLHKPVGLHVVTALEAIPFRARVAVVDHCALEFPDYRVVHNLDPEAGLSRSVCLGVKEARGFDPESVLIALADMPRVTATHVYRLLDTAEGPDAVIASSDGERPRPPALFGSAHFDFLMTLQGDTGARDLVRAGKHVVTSPAELIDIDTPEDLEALRASVRPAAVTRDAGRRSD